MPVTNRHYLYDTQALNWQTMRDCAAGENVIKNKGIQYLPMPSGFTAQPDLGIAMYNAYALRAQFPDILEPTQQGMVGVIHRVEAQIEGLEEGSGLEFLHESCTLDGLTLEAFHRMITAELLLTGRYSILVDVPSEGNGLPYFAGYTAEQLINWVWPDRDMFVINESRSVQGEIDEFTWIPIQRYRVLRWEEDANGKGKYTQQVFGSGDALGQGDTTNPSSETSGWGGPIIEPQARGGGKLPEIPFVVVGPRNLSLELDPPPLLGVARASLAIYRLDADYRHQLFHSGQETAVFIGDMQNYPRVLGSGVVVGMPANSDAKYLSPACSGIDATRVAMQDDRQSAVAAGVRLFDDKASAESGEALRLRASAQTATLTTIALSSAAALEKCLRYAAMFLGKDPESVIVKPNLKFVDTTLPPTDAVALVTVWQSGAISHETLYEDLQRGEIASAERTYEEEKALIDQEAIDNPPVDGTGGPSGGAAPAPGGNPSRFVETGAGLSITPAGG